MLEYNIQEMNERTFSFIYGCALHDAILQKAFDGKKDWIEKVTSAQEPVKEYINAVLAGKCNDKNIHEEVFLAASKKVCDIINEKKPKDVEDRFSFGNAQKLLNITVKHIYAHTYSFNFLNQTNIRENFSFCHCPMDSIMLSHVWKKYKEKFNILERRNKLGERDDFLKSWGSEDFELINGERVLPKRYVQYQEAIERLKGVEIFSIEYDYITWKNNQVQE